MHDKRHDLSFIYHRQIVESVQDYMFDIKTLIVSPNENTQSWLCGKLNCHQHVKSEFPDGGMSSNFTERNTASALGFDV